VRPLPPAAPNQAQSASQSSTPSTARKNCPSPKPEFDARKLRNAKWSSNEEVNKFGQAKTGSGSSEKKRFGLLQMVQKVHRLKDEKPKTTNLWDLTEIL